MKILPLIQVFVGLFALWLVAVAPRPVRADTPLEDATPPQNPREFHEQEWRRIVRGLEAFEESPLTSTQADYDALYYHLTVDVRSYAAHLIYGNVEIVARSVADDLDELVLDLCSTLTVDSAVFGDTAQPYTRAGHVLTVTLDHTYDMDEIVNGYVYYHGQPCNTNLFPSFIYYNRPVGPNTVPSISTLSEPYGARDWWPCKNDPSDKADSVRVSILVADTLTATSNGLLESVTAVNPSSRLFTWFERHPIATYLVPLNATNYTSFSAWYTTLSNDSMPIVHYVYPERLAPAQISWNALPAMMDFCAGLWGEYPYVDEKYGHTMFNVSGGMEHQCNTSFGRAVTDGQHTYDYIVVHELVHQWFGDGVTLATWPDVWLNEGFASYGEALWFEQLNGSQALIDYMTTPNNNGVVDPSGPVYDPSSLFNSNTVYNKGSWILHMLRGVMQNDSMFFALMREYYHRHAYGNATTAQFLADASDVAGFDVTPFLSAYLYLTNRPHFRVSFGSGMVDGAMRTVVRIRQVQTDPDTTFQTRLDLSFAGAQDTTLSVINALWNERYYVNLGWSPTGLDVDPQEWVLKELSQEALPVTILTTSVAFGLATLPYSDTLTATGGTAPYTWSLAGGALPTGIALSSGGMLSGTAMDVGSYAFTARASDGSGAADTMSLVLEIRSPLTPPQRLTVYRSGANSIALRWRTVALADSYYVFRATLPNLADATLISVTAITKALDSLDPPGQPGEIARRFYYVVAVRHTPQ